MSAPRSITVFTRQSPSPEIEQGLHKLIAAAREAGIAVRVPAEEMAKHSLEEAPGLELAADLAGPTDLAVALGGDGTILHTMRCFAGRDVPVLSVNFGTVGFLATVEDIDEGIRRVTTGDYERLTLPTLEFDVGERKCVAVNDVSFHRRPELRVAELRYSVVGEEIGMVRCDGLVLSTPAGSTGYNLANGGPVLAWGVEGYVVSFIAPHTLTARALVVAPDDPLRVTNMSSREPVDVTTDGRTVWSLEPHEHVEVRFRRDSALLAQVEGATFYHRLRDKFGHLTH